MYMEVESTIFLKVDEERGDERSILAVDRSMIGNSLI